MPTFRREDTNAILAFFGQTSTRGSTQPKDEEYYTSNTPTRSRPTPTRRPSSNVVTPTTAPGGLPTRRPTTVPRDEAYYTSTAPKKTPVKPPAPKVKRNTNTVQPITTWRDEVMTVGPQPRPQQGPQPRPTPTWLQQNVNQWQQQAPKPVFQGYNVAPTRVDYALNRPDTGVNAVQQSVPVGGQTVRSPIAPRLPAYGGPADDAYYTQQDAPPQRWTPGQPPVASAPPILPLVNAARDVLPSSWDEARDWASAGARGWWSLVDDTAAVDRAQYDINQRTQERNAALGQTWGDWLTDAGQNISEAWGGLQGALARQTMGQGNAAEVGLGTVNALLTPVGQALNITSPTRYAKDAALNVMSGLQAGQDLLYNYPYLPGDVPLSAYIASGVDEAGQNFQAFYNDPQGSMGEMWQNFQSLYRDPVGALTKSKAKDQGFNAFGSWLQAVQDTVEQYKQAVTPTAQQIATYGAQNIPKAQEYAYLNTLGGLQSLTNTFDALVDQKPTVDKLNAEANQLFLQGAQAIDEDLRQELWYQAAQKGYEANRLASTHPIQLVNENTNLLRQLATEILLPDVTDLLAGVFSLAELTPKARRLTSVTNKVLTPQEQAVKALQSMIVNPANQAAIMAERSTYNKLWNVWATGNARANQAADKMQRFVTNLLSEVETPGDARLLLNQLATDPTKLLTGIQAGAYQGANLLARAGQDGLIRFGNMNLQNLKEPLRIYQQAAQDFLQNSKALQSGPILNKIDFMVEFTDAMKQAGYRFYNVLDEGKGIPTGTKTTRLRAVTGGQYVVEYVDSAKKVIGTSDPMLIQDARKLQGQFRGGQASAPQSTIKAIGSTMRKIVSVPYILGNPGTWVTNAVSGVASAVGDGVFSTESRNAMRKWKAGIWGVDPTLRGLEGADTAQGFAQNAMGGGILQPFRNAYSQIDETVGERVWHASAQHGLRTAGKPILQNVLTPILNSLGIVKPREIKRITNHLLEVGMSGGNLAEEWARLMTGNSRVFSLGDVNSQWLGAIPETALEEFYTIIRSAPDKATATAQLQAWHAKATKYWDELIATAATEPQRHVWMKQEVTQDAADLTQSARVATKYGNVPVDEANAWVKQAGTQLQDIQRRQETLMQLVADAKDPANRYMLYNIWGQVTDLTANVRAQLTELAERAGQAPAGAGRQAAWGEYWTTARRLWDERNTNVNTLLEQATTAISSGQPFTPQFDVWRMLERTAQTNEAKLWEALRLEPQSGTYDQRLAQVIDAGRQIADKAVARTYAAARRFTQVDAIDHIVSAEHTVQLAGAKARAYLDKVLDGVMKSGRWEEYFSIRNEVWRQLRQYERDVWGLAERDIVREGLATEATTGLRFDAGPDGVVELVRPEAVPTQKTSRLEGKKTVTTEQKAYWTVKREDGSITRVPDSMVPTELKDRYNGITPDEIEAQTTLEMDNIASAEPFAPEAQRIIDGPDIDAAPSRYAEAEIIEPELQRPPNESVQTPTVQAVAPVRGLRGYLGEQEVVILGRGDGETYRYRLADGTEGAASMTDLAIVDKNGVRRSLANVAGMRTGNTPAPAPVTPPTINRVSAEQVNELRRMADRAGIQTATSTGAPMDKRLINTINKDLEIKVRRLADLTPDQYEAAMDALEVRRLGLDVEEAADPAAAWRAQTQADRAATPAPVAPPPAPVTPPPVAQVGDLNARLATVLNQAGRNTRVRLAELVGQFSAEEWPQVQRALRDLQLNGDVILMPIDDPKIITAADRAAAIDLGGDQRMIVYVKNRIEPRRTLESTTPLFDYEKWARKNVGKGLDLSPGIKKAQALKTPPVTPAAPDIAQGAAFAKQQLDNILQYTTNNLDEILRPAKGLGQGQSLRALDDFRKGVLPAWDNAKYIASEYGNKMRGFTLVDFINETRLDELMSLWMPYGFWMTRTAKNSLERALFQPHIWRRVMQSEVGIRDMQEQRDDPQRYEGGIPIDLGNGTVIYLRILPSKYWQAAGLFTHNDYADPESANSALGFAMESLQSANLNGYPWFDIGQKWLEGNQEDIYYANYTPQTRMLADLTVKMMGANAPTWAWTSFLDNTAARVLNNMAVKGEISREEAMWAHQYIRQMTTGEAMLPEQQQLDQAAMQAIVTTALRRAAGDDLWPAVSSWLTGAQMKPYDPAEGVWRGAQSDYYNNQYGPQNPYGSHLASQVSKEDASLGWSKSAVADPTRTAPGVMLVTEQKKEAKETINQDLMSATDAWILAQEKTPTNKEINEFKTQYIGEKLGTEGDYYGDMISTYLDETFPSAQAYEGDGSRPPYQGYAPEEKREAVRVAAYYQAKDDIDAPVYPGDGKSREEYKAYYEAKANYEDALEARVDQLINDPQWLAIQSGNFLRTTRTGESEGSYRLITPTLDNAFGVPVRPTGDPQNPNMSGLVDLAGSPETAKDIIIGERTKYMGPVEKEVRAANEANGDKSGRFSARGNRRYPSRSSRRRYYGGGGRRYYGGGGGGSSGFRYPQMPDAQGLDSSLWSQDAIRAWRPWNNSANDWLYAGRELGPDRLEDWKPIKV